MSTNADGRWQLVPGAGLVWIRDPQVHAGPGGQVIPLRQPTCIAGPGGTMLPVPPSAATGGAEENPT